MTSKLQKAHYFGIPSPATARYHHSATDSVEVIVLAAQEAGNDDPTAWILQPGIYFLSLTVLYCGRVFIFTVYLLRLLSSYLGGYFLGWSLGVSAAPAWCSSVCL